MEGNNKNIKVRKVEDQEDYEKSGFKGMMDDVEYTKKESQESVPQISREQISSEETTKELLDGSTDIKKKAK
jgi:division protein CdvB (Snf7/Vps24/ESCRT-III family)